MPILSQPHKLRIFLISSPTRIESWGMLGELVEEEGGWGTHKTAIASGNEGKGKIDIRVKGKKGGSRGGPRE